MKRTLSTPKYKRMPILRIAPVCNGKIYVIPHVSECNGIQLDIPIKEHITHISTASGKVAKNLVEKYRLHLSHHVQPRFSIKYRISEQDKDEIYLYILPLKQEEDIGFQEGKFVTIEEIKANEKLYSPNLQKESELLAMAAELWKDYFQKIGKC